MQDPLPIETMLLLDPRTYVRYPWAMLRGLYGLIADRGGKWAELSGSGYIRARIYRSVAVFVSLVLDERGAYRVVEQHGVNQRPVTVHRGQLPERAPGEPADWPAESIRLEAGLQAEKP
jgi:hypothetical protein